MPIQHGRIDRQHQPLDLDTTVFAVTVCAFLLGGAAGWILHGVFAR